MDNRNTTLSPNLVMEHRNTVPSLATLTQKRFRIIRAAIVLMILSLLCQLIGFVSPGWVWFEMNDLTFHFGLWYSIRCTSRECKTTFVNADPYSKSLMLAYQVETSIAIICCIFAIVTLFIHKQHLAVSRNNIGLYILTTIAVLGSGLLCLVAAGKFACEFLKLISTLFPFALLFTGLGGILSSVVFLAIVCMFFCQSSRDNLFGYQVPENMQPMTPVHSTVPLASSMPQDQQHLALSPYTNENKSAALLPPSYGALFEQNGNNALKQSMP